MAHKKACRYEPFFVKDPNNYFGKIHPNLPNLFFLRSEKSAIIPTINELNNSYKTLFLSKLIDI